MLKELTAFEELEQTAYLDNYYFRESIKPIACYGVDDSSYAVRSAQLAM